MERTARDRLALSREGPRGVLENRRSMRHYSSTSVSFLPVPMGKERTSIAFRDSGSEITALKNETYTMTYS